MSMVDLALKLESVNFSFTKKSLWKREKRHVIKDMDLEVYQGETLGLLGGNGAGKSTLLKLLAGIYKPNSGVVETYGNKVSLLTLAAGFDMDLTGRDNALLGAMLLGHSKKSALEALDEICEISELSEQFNDPVKTYSSGMFARLGFATAVSMKTDILLIDEVLSVGDASFQKKAENIIKSKTQSDMTVVIVSHVMESIDNLCDRTITIETGARC
ncbi:hypothetical protein BM527_16535 [Alteromonas sp. Mex14]|nr:hypothetical protein BM527_16535 [Alteromonas sp. Mex14]